MKTLKTLTALAFAGLFATAANAGSFTTYDYEDYVQSGAWPGDSTTAETPTNIADISKMMETSPTAAGSHSFDDEVLLLDLFGNDIHRQL